MYIWVRYKKNVKFTLWLIKNLIKKFNRPKELYCDATMFVFRFFIVYLPKKNGN